MYIYFDESYIEHDKKAGLKNIYDADGDYVCAFPDNLSDEDIGKVVPLLNGAFREGVRLGQAQKAAELRTCLDL